MRDLLIQQAHDTFFKFPKINFDGSSGNCSIEGEAFMDNPKLFFKPITEWFVDFKNDYKLQEVTLSINLTYYNTSCSKSLYDLIVNLKKIQESGHKTVLVKWYYKSDDFEMEDDIMDVKAESGMVIEMIAYD